MRRTPRSFAGKAVFVTAVAAALVLTGCSSSEPDAGGTTSEGPSSEAPETTDAPEPVTIEISWWGNEERAALFDQVIQLFEAEYDWITVEQTPVPDPDTLFNRLATDFAGGGSTAPDVFALGGAKPQEYGADGQLLDLSTVSEWLDTSNYPEFSLTNAIVDDVLYGLPTGGNATAAFVNEDVFAEAGVEVPGDDWTWDDFVTAANAIGSAGLTTDTGAQVMGVDMRIQDILGTFAGQETEYGIYDWDGNVDVAPETIAKFLDIELELQAGGGLPDPEIIVQNQNLASDLHPFGLGQAGITFGYSNLVDVYGGGGTVRILLPPTDTDKVGIALLPSAFWSINASTEHPREAALLVDWFLNQPAAAELILDTRGVPFNPDTLAAVRPLLEGPSQVAADYVDKALELGDVAPPQPAGGARMNEYSQFAESEVLFGRQDPLAASTDFVNKLTADVAAAG